MLCHFYFIVMTYCLSSYYLEVTKDHPLGTTANVTNITNFEPVIQIEKDCKVTPPLMSKSHMITCINRFLNDTTCFDATDVTYDTMRNLHRISDLYNILEKYKIIQQIKK